MDDWSFLQDFSHIFISLFVQGLPFLLAGSFLGAVATGFLPVERWLGRLPKSPWVSAPAGALAALFIPSCECMVIPLIRRLVRSGLPAPTAIAYLLAAPVLNPLCILSTYSAFNASQPLWVSGLRVGGSFLLAVTLALVFSRGQRAKLFVGDLALSINPRAPKPPRPTLQSLLGATLSDFWSVAGFYIFGSLSTALLQTLPWVWTLSNSINTGVPAILSMMFLAVLLSICSSVDAFIANSFVGYPFSAQLAFLWIGPVLDLKLIMVYQTLFRRKKLLMMILGMVIIVFIMAYMTDLLWSVYA